MNQSSADSSSPPTIWLASYPRSGNTFIRILLHDCFGISAASKYEKNAAGHAIQKVLGETGSPPKPSGILKTHDYPEDDARCIYLIRDGRSAVISYHQYFHNFTKERPTLEDVIVGNVQFGSWSDHFRAWAPLTRPNTLLLRFEEFTADPSSAVDRLSKFLRLAPIRAFDRTFESLNKADPVFFRSGKSQSEFLNKRQTKLFNVHHGSLMEKLGYKATKLDMVLKMFGLRDGNIGIRK